MEPSSCEGLVRQVIARDLCTLCGACVGRCPYFMAYRGKIVLRDSCNLEQGQCYLLCPRVSFDPDAVCRALFGEPYDWHGLGPVRKIFVARSTEASVKSNAQYGGVVTSLIAMALDQGIIHSAVLTRSKDRVLTEGMTVSSREAVLECAGSNYVAAPTIEALNRDFQNAPAARVGVVGVPCQVMALAKAKYLGDTGEDNQVARPDLVVGLFCTWALSYEGFAAFLETTVSAQKILKVDIPPPPANLLEIRTPEGRITMPLEEIRPFIRPACNTCIDMTAEFADISVGAAEGMEGWNTVIVRSETGDALLQAARDRGLVETADLPEHNLEHLKEASLLKKKRALKNIIQKSGTRDDLLYLLADPAVLEPLLEED